MNELYNICEIEENYNKIFTFDIDINKFKSSYIYNHLTRTYSGVVAKVKDIKMIMEMPEHKANYILYIEKNGYNIWQSKIIRKSDKEPVKIECNSINQADLEKFFIHFKMMQELIK